MELATTLFEFLASLLSLVGVGEKVLAFLKKPILVDKF